MSITPTVTPRMGDDRPRFLKVSEAAVILRVSPDLIYKSIGSGDFPALKFRGRYVIPAKVVDAMESAMMTEVEAVMERLTTTKFETFPALGGVR
jgi:excisionase family DNA binding protein